MMIDPSTLAIGGIAAAIGAFWQQAKQIFSYLSSFIVVTSHYDECISRDMIFYIRHHYSLLPSGILHYCGWCFYPNKQNVPIIIPFRVPAMNAIFFRKGEFIIVSAKRHGNLSIKTIRGLVNFDKLLSEALDFYYQERCKTEDEVYDAYSLEDVIGAEKNASSFGSRPDVGRKGGWSGSPPDSSNLEAQVSNSGYSLDLRVDRSYKYSPDFYNIKDKYDPFETLYYDAQVWNVVEQIGKWRKMQHWYAERNIPWRRGILLHGPAGTGKSSFVKAIGQKFGFRMYRYHLATLSDQEFIENWKSMIRPCIVLFEDFDAIFDKRKALTKHQSLSFDCILNQISGVEEQHGILLTITTNNLDKIDEAIGIKQEHNNLSTRPGRIDDVIFLGFINEENRKKMAYNTLRDWPNEIPALINVEEDLTPIQFQEMCLQVAFNKLQELK